MQLWSKNIYLVSLGRQVSKAATKNMMMMTFSSVNHNNYCDAFYQFLQLDDSYQNVSHATARIHSVPEWSSVRAESLSSLISLMQPSWRRILSIFVRSTSRSHSSLRSHACGTCAVHVSVKSRVRYTFPSQKSRSAQCSRDPSSMHSRERRTMWVSGEQDTGY